uniref:Saposin B-type domain-containing protein n=1 Tax=Macrostomum lignano TaxID=282301 RepID=A0A1I8FIN6_9PLAT
MHKHHVVDKVEQACCSNICPIRQLYTGGVRAGRTRLRSVKPESPAVGKRKQPSLSAFDALPVRRSSTPPSAKRARMSPQCQRTAASPRNRQSADADSSCFCPRPRKVECLALCAEAALARLARQSPRLKKSPASQEVRRRIAFDAESVCVACLQALRDFLWQQYGWGMRQCGEFIICYLNSLRAFSADM